jgi:hypothetical protein
MEEVRSYLEQFREQIGTGFYTIWWDLVESAFKILEFKNKKYKYK